LVECKQYRKKRTLPQNSLLHLWCTCVADETGSTLYDIKEYVRDKWVPEVEYKVFGEARTRKLSTAELDTKQFSEVLSAFDADVSTEGIRLPYPADQYFEEFYGKYKSMIR